MTTVTQLPPAARPVAQEWNRLAEATPDPGVFDPTDIGDLPEAARRWLTHAIPAGTPLSRSVQLTMHGRIRIGKWRSFTATQIIKPADGYIWAATTHVAGLPITGYDRYSDGSGQMRWRLAGTIPMVSAARPRRHAQRRRPAGLRNRGRPDRLPSRDTGPPATTSDTAVATSHIGDHLQQVMLRVHPDGSLRDVMLQRWGNPAGSPFALYPFGVTVEEEAVLDGVTIPSVIRAGWFWGTDRQDEGEFFRATITDAVFR